MVLASLIDLYTYKWAWIQDTDTDDLWLMTLMMCEIAGKTYPEMHSTMTYYHSSQNCHMALNATTSNFCPHYSSLYTIIVYDVYPDRLFSPGLGI